MKKTVFKACTALLVLAMVLQLALPQMAILANAASQSGTCGANVSWEFDDSTGKLTISGTGDMDDYSYENPAPWGVGTEGRDQRALKAVVIQKGVTSMQLRFCKCFQFDWREHPGWRDHHWKVCVPGLREIGRRNHADQLKDHWRQCIQWL